MPKVRSELTKLTDEELVQKYQSEEFTQRESWGVLLDRHLELIKNLFYERFAWLGPQKTDLFDSTFKLALERKILSKWDNGGMSVKNWIVNHLVYWLPGDTDFYERWKDRKEHWEYEPEEELELIRQNVEESQVSEMDGFFKKLEKQAMNFLETALNDSESSLTRKRKESRQLVLKTLKDNYEKEGTEGIKSDKKKAGEVDMTKNAFSVLKVRALDDLVGELEKRSFSYEIIPTFSWILNFRVDSLAARVEELKENS